MPGNCILAHCKGKNASLHSFPLQNEALNRKWIDFVREKRRDFQRPTKHSKLCSDHFVEGDFANLLQYRLGIANRRLLKEDAVPSMHVPSSTEEDGPELDTAQWLATYATCTQIEALKTPEAASASEIKTENDPEPLEATSHPGPADKGMCKPGDTHTQTQAITVKQEPLDEEACCSHRNGEFPSSVESCAMQHSRVLESLQRQWSGGPLEQRGMERPHRHFSDSQWPEETRVQLGPAFLQWRILREAMQMSSDAQLAMFLLNNYYVTKCSVVKSQSGPPSPSGLISHPTPFQELGLFPCVQTGMPATNAGLSSGPDLGIWSPQTPVESRLQPLMQWHLSPEQQSVDLKGFPLPCLSAEGQGKATTLEEALRTLDRLETTPWNMPRAPEQPVFPLRSPLRHARINPVLNQKSPEAAFAPVKSDKAQELTDRAAESLDFSSDVSAGDLSAPKSLLRKILTSPSTLEHLRDDVNVATQILAQSKTGLEQTGCPASNTRLRKARDSAGVGADQSISGGKEKSGVQAELSGRRDEEHGGKAIKSKNLVGSQDTDSGSWHSDDFDLFPSSEGNNRLRDGCRRKRKTDDESDEEWMPTDDLSDSDNDSRDSHNKRTRISRRRATQQRSKAGRTGWLSERRSQERQRTGEKSLELQNNVDLNGDSKGEGHSWNSDVSSCKFSAHGGGEKELCRVNDLTVSAWTKG